MQNHILEYLEKSCGQLPHKTVYQDESRSVTFLEVMEQAKAIGSYLTRYTKPNCPVVIISDKSVLTPVLYLAVLYSGCFYVPVGKDLPTYRMELILQTVEAGVILVDHWCQSLAETLDTDGHVILAEEAVKTEIDQKEILKRRQSALDTDPAYVIFTSGSTGKPKGVIQSHRALIDYIDVFAETFHIGQDECFGNQAPLDYIAAIRDIYLPLKTGASMVMIPKKLFSLPGQLFDYINQHNMTTLCWVVSAFCLCSGQNAFSHAALKTVKKVFFTGAVMPCKDLRVWQEQLPEALFVNHYGPTEITASCTYHIVEDLVNTDDVLPIGIPFKNTGVLILNGDNTEAQPGDVGEICVKGSCLSLGYYKNQEKTTQVFIKNPLNSIYDEIIYKTGDIGYFDQEGILQFKGRKDSQIKHAGHRIELSEIEGTARMMDSIRECCCLYHEQKEQLWLFYTGEELDKRTVAVFLRERLPSYMIPRKFRELDQLPKQFNGKIDVNKLKQMMR